ncbi:related to lipoyltransferase [Cephalotrichum gorgonifer]|uniref:Putative lipoate-protein ligase A n=1 Tax=Cephalotrichum gorgonifer TaxID=2041049 RepID=A0AAE8N1U9_9PEZI|nr:related to lipoyltransferase [Cephalotrichum gorgonifer]
MRRASPLLSVLRTTLSRVGREALPHPHHRPHLQGALPRRHFTSAASDPSNKIQFYLSRSNDPYLNLSIEHHLLQNTPADSTVLFVYTNRPCIVIGRNQNPWVEVNLPLVESLRSHGGRELSLDEPLEVDLVRRRSGGGAVFHDGGNVNYCVICPPAVFDRDRHAEMVVRALRGLGVSGARVNARHDIVVDSAADGQEGEPLQTFKVSGSAFKLTRLRSLHHGTCLLSSPNLGGISEFLRSPGEPFIKARGVESVRSRVRNVGVGNAEFEEGVRAEFGNMYGGFDVDCVVGDEAGEISKIKEGMMELKSRDWIYGQTPRFTFSTTPTAEDPRPRPAISFDADLRLDVRQGIIQELTVDGKSLATLEKGSNCFYDLPSWGTLMESAGMESTKASRVGSRLQELLGGSRKTV